MMAIAGIIPVAKWLTKIKQLSDVSCRLCKRAREQRGASIGNLPEETYGHINGAFCDGMATTVTAAHHFIWRHLYASIQAAQTPTSKLRFVTPDRESSMSTLWHEEEFKQICSRESLTEKAAEIEKTIVVKEHERARYAFDPTMFYENRFWNRGPDGIVIDKYHRTLYILEFKRSSDRNKDFLRVKEEEANEQHRSIKGGPEPLEKEIHKILGSKREDRFSDPFLKLVQKISGSFFCTCLITVIYVRTRGHCESVRRSARR